MDGSPLLTESRTMNVLNELRRARFIAIARRVPRDKVVPCAEALVQAGVTFLEVTFDPSDPETLADTAEKVRLVRSAFPALHTGCGTVLTPEMAEAAADAGAEYCVAPNTKAAVIERAHARGLLAFPGAFTPCEIANAYDLGADAVKIFPVQPGEEAYVRNVMSPLSHIPFLLTGGVNPATIRAMLATGALAVAAGASILRPDLVAAADYGAIAALAKQHLENM